MENLLNLTEAVKVIPVSEGTFRRAIKSGRIQYTTNEKGRRLFDPAELQRVFGKDGTPPPSEPSEAGTPVVDENKTSDTEKDKPVTSNEPVTALQPHDKYDLLRLQRLGAYDVVLEGVYLDDVGEITRIDLLDAYAYVEEAIEEWQSLTKAPAWLDTYDRDDAILHDAGEYERINMRRYDAVVVISENHKYMVGAVNLDDTGIVHRRYVVCTFDSLEGALSFARKLTGEHKIKIINS